MKKFLPWLRWVVPALVASFCLDYFTRSELPYPLPTTLTVKVRGEDGGVVGGAWVEIEAVNFERRDSLLEAQPTKIGSGSTGEDGRLTLSLDIPGTIEEGWVSRGIRWLGEDTPRRRSAIRTVLSKTRIRVVKAGLKPAEDFLRDAKLAKGHRGESLFIARPELAMTFEMTMEPATGEPK